MSCSGTSNCACGCCAGTSVQTPQGESNRSGLSAVSYRTGTWATFKESMLAQLSSSDYPALQKFTARQDGDFTVALLDATSMMLDVLTFYQERLANESYLETAVQPESLTELARLVDYQPTPGVSAQTYLAFTLRQAPGATPTGPSIPVTVPAGTQVQSVPPQGQTPQTFETFRDLTASPDWNAVPVQTGSPWQPWLGDLGIYLQGTATQLQRGDGILIVGDERATNPQSNRWDLRTVVSVEPDPANNRTYVTFDRGLGNSADHVWPSSSNPRFFALRQRAALFGFNAPDPNLFNTTNTPTMSNLISTQADGLQQWDGFQINTQPAQIDLDSSYSKILPDSWVVLQSDETAPPVDAYYEEFAQNVTNLFNANQGLNINLPLALMANGLIGAFLTLIQSASVDLQAQALSLYTQAFAESYESFLDSLTGFLGGFLSLGAVDQAAIVNQVVMLISSGTAVQIDALQIEDASLLIQDQVNLVQQELPPVQAFLQKLQDYYNLLQSQLAQAVTQPKQSTALFRASQVSQTSRSDFSLSAKITRVVPDAKPSYTAFPLRETTVLAQSEELEVCEQPLTYPLYGSWIHLENLWPNLSGLQVLAVTGKQQKIAVATGAQGLQFVPDDSTLTVSNLSPGDVLTLAPSASANADPLPTKNGGPDWSYTGQLSLGVLDANGTPGTVMARLNQFVLVSPGPKDPVVSETAVVSKVDNTSDPAHTYFQLKTALTYCYDRGSSAVNANVVLATHGQSVSEILGSGSASTPNQSFTLKQANATTPLTYVQSAGENGMSGTFQLSVNSVDWAEADTLYGEGPNQQVYNLVNQSDGTTQIVFGDGVEGALLPTGQNNIQAQYRVGSGTAGNVGVGTLVTLLDRPLGVSGVTNPEDATGGQDPESADDIRANAPQATLTLGRVVSITDYQSYAKSFTSIAKAYALWVPSGPGRGVFLTVAGPGGLSLDGSATLGNLVASLQSIGNPLIPLNVVSYRRSTFGFSADLQVDPNYDFKSSTAQAQVMLALNAAFGFDQRDFGQSVSMDEVASVIQAVPGILAVNVKNLHRTGSGAGNGNLGQAGFFLLKGKVEKMGKLLLPRGPHSASSTLLGASLPVADPFKIPDPAEILVLDPNPDAVELGVMP